MCRFHLSAVTFYLTHFCGYLWSGEIEKSSCHVELSHKSANHLPALNYTSTRSGNDQPQAPMNRFPRTSVRPRWPPWQSIADKLQDKLYNAPTDPAAEMYCWQKTRSCEVRTTSRKLSFCSPTNETSECTQKMLNANAKTKTKFKSKQGKKSTVVVLKN